MSAAAAAVAAAWLAAACVAGLCLLPAPVASPVQPRRSPRARPADHAGSSALVADAAAALLRSGASVTLALQHLGAGNSPAPELAVVARMLAWGATPEQAWAWAPQHRGLREALALAEGTGAPVSVVLSRRAHEQRRGRARDEEARAASLAVKLVLPMGLCGLPAFICLGVVPIALALMPW
ncbi:MAG: type II secretion system F family protein [Galactobacter sp.]